MGGSRPDRHDDEAFEESNESDERKMKTKTILLVEGQRAAQDSFDPALKKAGYTVFVATTGASAFEWLKSNRPDLVIFDAASMRSSGTRTCRRIRIHVGDTPIIHCRVSGQQVDTTAEADVYLMQPFTSRKLINRVRDLLPADEAKEEVVRCGSIVLYLTKRAIDVNGRGERRVTPKVVQLLAELARYPNQVISRAQLMQNVWNTDFMGDTRTLDVHIRWAREHIEVNPSQPKILRTVRGEGYILALDALR